MIAAQDTTGFYTTIIRTMENETFLKHYIDAFSKPLDLYAFDLLYELLQSVKAKLDHCRIIYNARQYSIQPQNTHPETATYKHHLPASSKTVFQYHWLKTTEDFKAHCKKEDDEYCCDNLYDPLSPNHAFSVSYTQTNTKGEITTFTNCYDESFVLGEESSHYTFVRHPILRDDYIDMGAIRELKAAANTGSASGGASAAKGRFAPGGRRSPGGAKKSRSHA